jgi:hypothetical protein
MSGANFQNQFITEKPTSNAVGMVLSVPYLTSYYLIVLSSFLVYGIHIAIAALRVHIGFNADPDLAFYPKPFRIWTKATKSMQILGRPCQFIHEKYTFEDNNSYNLHRRCKFCR